MPTLSCFLWKHQTCLPLWSRNVLYLDSIWKWEIHHYYNVKTVLLARGFSFGSDESHVLLYSCAQVCFSSVWEGLLTLFFAFSLPLKHGFCPREAICSSLLSFSSLNLHISEQRIWLMNLHLKYAFKIKQKQNLTGKCQIFLTFPPARTIRLHVFASPFNKYVITCLSSPSKLII